MIASLDISVEVDGGKEPVTMNRMFTWLDNKSTWESAVQQLILEHVRATKVAETEGAHLSYDGKYDLDDGRRVDEYSVAFTRSFHTPRFARVAVQAFAEETQLMVSHHAMRQLRQRAQVCKTMLETLGFG